MLYPQNGEGRLGHGCTAVRSVHSTVTIEAAQSGARRCENSYDDDIALFPV